MIEILISTMRREGIERIASLSHPEMHDVRYLVSWQCGDMSAIPQSIACRDDFKVVLEDSVGLSKNRNNALRHAEADWVLISDDDLIYTQSHLNNAIKAFENNSDCSVLAFKYESDDFPREYPEKEFNLDSPPKGYFTVSFEIGLNLKRLREELNRDVIPAFNENFGLGARFGSGEEDLFIAGLMQNRLTGRFIPVSICEHPGPTTGIKQKTVDGFIQTKGAVIYRLRPLTWPLRMILYAWRSASDKTDRIPFFHYLRNFLAGIKTARKFRVYDFNLFMKK